MSISQVIVFPVVATDHELNIVSKVAHVLICRIYQLIPHASVAPLRSKVTVPVANEVQLVGESNVGAVGGVVSLISKPSI